MSLPSGTETTLLPSFDGAELAVHTIGSGRPLVLLHGLFSDAHTNWIKFGAAARVAAEGRRVIMPDFRGHGASARPVDSARWPADVLVRDIAWLVEALGLDDYDLGGFSLGARTTARLMAGGLVPRRAMLAGMGLEGLTGWSRRRGFFDAAIDAYDTASRGDAHWLAIQFMKTMKVDPAMARLLLASFPADETLDLARIAAPTLVLCGDSDDDNGSAAELAAALPDATLCLTPGTHMSSVTKPEFGEAIAQWFAPLGE